MSPLAVVLAMPLDAIKTESIQWGVVIVLFLVIGKWPVRTIPTEVPCARLP
jgi:hypothetical protein